MTHQQSLSPLSWKDYRLFLKQLYIDQKGKKGRYSYRQFAKDLGFRSSNYLHLIIQKKQKRKKTKVLFPALGIEFRSCVDLLILICKGFSLREAWR